MGRRALPKIDPTVDLAKQPHDLRPASWIRPFDATATARLTRGDLGPDEE